MSRSALTRFLFSPKLSPQTMAFLGYWDTSVGTDTGTSPLARVPKEP